MAAITSTIDLEFIRLGSKDTPDIYLSEPSAAGSTSLKFTSAITQEDNSTAVAKAMILGFKAGGKVMIVYIAAGGFSSTTAATITTRPMLRGGLDFTTAAASSEDFDLPAGTRVYAVISAFHGEQNNAAQQAAISQSIKHASEETFDNAVAAAIPVYADAATGEAAITGSNGRSFYATAEGVVREYIAGAWGNSTGIATPNASTTVAGKVEEATVAEQGTATTTGGSGARLFPANANLVKTSSEAADENKIVVLGANGKFALGFMPTGFVNIGAFSGDGNDGDVTISGNTTLARDMYYNNLTVDNGFTLTTGGYRVFVKGTLTNNGTIEYSGTVGGAGGNGGNAAGGAGGAAGSAGSAASALSSGTIFGALAGVVGVAGGAGGVGLNNGSVGVAGTNGTAETISLPDVAGVVGTQGGVGGDSSARSGGAGGAAGTGGAATDSNTKARDVVTAIQLMETGTSLSILHGAAISASGSGGGGGAGTGTPSNGGGGGGAGGSASNGGFVLIVAETIINSATGIIRANGGIGGAGGDGGTGQSGDINGSGGGAGGAGGSGGQGGVVILIYGSLTDSGTIETVAGVGGAAGSSGAGGTGSGTNGTAGAVGSAGTTGNAGVVISLDI